ncbi:succinate dehydrogenase cytochrome b558 subunit [Longirhabdus pacifica]|uniref:succinate dehydrogenase cytochrome b558 subunit n=1 Tax=Longirhabdus pacifica TaxID=2305227 RepID=UPI0010088E37|nr:succinate dehydrogenase cytochrome b558 subunit [Longirhabdus pacifica]
MKLNSFYSRKLHSLLGVIPLGLFLVNHLLTNYEAFRGGLESFNDKVESINSLPLILLLEIFGIWLPLLYHGVYGLYIAYQARNNVNRFSYFRNKMFLIQRITGVITLVFVAWHIFDTRVQVALGNVTHDQLGQRMHETLSNPIFFSIYIIGIIAAVFHFCNGMWSFLVSWGITIGPKAQRISTYIWMTAFVVLTIMFIVTLVAFTGEEFAAVTSLMSHVG